MPAAALAAASPCGRQGGQAAVSLKIAGQGLDVGQVLPQAGLTGRADVELDGASSSETVAGLVGGLSGGGLMRLRGATLARLDVRGLAAVTSTFDAERDPPDLARVRASLAAAFDRGALPGGRHRRAADAGERRAARRSDDSPRGRCGGERQRFLRPA